MKWWVLNMWILPSGRIPSVQVCFKKEANPEEKKSHRIYSESVHISSHTQLWFRLSDLYAIQLCGQLCEDRPGEKGVQSLSTRIQTHL